MSKKKRPQQPRRAEVLLQTHLTERERLNLLGEYEDAFSRVADTQGLFIVGLG